MNFNPLENFHKAASCQEAVQELFKKASSDLVEFSKNYKERLVTPGTYLDVKDSSNKWRLAKVLSIENKQAKIRFDAWNPKWDEVAMIFHLHEKPFFYSGVKDISVTSEKLQPVRTHTCHYTGPDSPVRQFDFNSLCDKVSELRKGLSMFRSTPLSDQNPYDVITLLRCEIFVVIDQILCFLYAPKDCVSDTQIKRMSPQQKTECFSFLIEFVEFGIEALSHVKATMPIILEWHSLKKPRLFLVNPFLAFASAIDEIFDCLLKIFGKEQRFVRFYEVHDFGAPSGQVVEGRKYISSKAVIPISIAVGHFVSKKGLDVILDMLSTEL